MVGQAAEQAFRDSKSGSTRPREQSAWIYARNGKIFVIRAKPGSAGRGYLSNPPQPRGALLVGTFHTHPVVMDAQFGFLYGGGPEPSDSSLGFSNDVDNAFRSGVPGITVAEVNGRLKLTPYGPDRGGSDPARAWDPKGPYGYLIRGYPGNTADTTACQ